MQGGRNLGQTDPEAVLLLLARTQTSQEAKSILTDSMISRYVSDKLHKSHVEAELQERSLGTQGSLPVETVRPYRAVDKGGERTEH